MEFFRAVKGTRFSELLLLELDLVSLVLCISNRLTSLMLIKLMDDVVNILRSGKSSKKISRNISALMAREMR